MVQSLFVCKEMELKSMFFHEHSGGVPVPGTGGKLYANTLLIPSLLTSDKYCRYKPLCYTEK